MVKYENIMLIAGVALIAGILIWIVPNLIRIQGTKTRTDGKTLAQIQAEDDAKKALQQKKAHYGYY